MKAEDARKLMPSYSFKAKYNDALKTAFKAIEQAAKDDRDSVILATEDDGLWSWGGYDNGERKILYTKVCNHLKELGYDVEWYYEERQFVVMHTIISWKKD
jgi:hypothetical protein